MLSLEELSDYSQQEIPCVVYQNVLYTKVLMRRIFLCRCSDEPWRENLKVNDAVVLMKYRSSFDCIVIEKNGEHVVIQPFGTDIEYTMSIYSFRLFPSTKSFDGMTRQSPVKHFDCLYNTVVANDYSWSGTIVDTDPRFNICLVQRGGRDPRKHGTRQ